MRTRKAIAPKNEPSDRDVRKKRFAGFTAVAKEFTSFRPASEVLTRVRAVPTIFPQFDHATKVGGLPIERFSLVHGPSAGGKTYFTIALLLSFLMRDHMAVLIDAERTTPITWLEKAMGEYHEHPFFFAERPESYEETRTAVRYFLNTLKAQRDKGAVSEDTTALLVVDSIRKLIPKDEFDRISKLARSVGDKDEKAHTRLAQWKAQMNSVWMDEIVVLLEKTKSAMVVIARETEDPDAPMRRGFGGRPMPKAYKVGGGSALYYDASMNMRVSRVKNYGKTVKTGDGSKMVPYGDLHRVDITKSKVSGKGEDFHASCTFAISNGVWVPAGFDRARDIIDLARRFGIVEGDKWLKYKSWKANGEDAAVKSLTDKPELLAAIEADCRAFSKKKQDVTRGQSLDNEREAS